MRHDDIRGVDGARALGFTEFEEIPLYKSMIERADTTKESVDKTLKPEELLYTKEIECPVCFGKIDMVSLKHNNQNRIVKDDSDFFKEYSIINPMFYEVILCNNCGYAALKSYFNTIFPKQRQLIKEKISSKWVRREYPLNYNLDIAIERYKLALINCVTKGTKSGEIASICLRLGWLYRIKEDNEKENYYLGQALYGFKEAIETENNSVKGMDDILVTYLIGELSMRLGDFDKASVYFSKVIMDKTAKPTIREKARNQRDLLREELKNQATKQDKTEETNGNVDINDSTATAGDTDQDSAAKKKFFFF